MPPKIGSNPNVVRSPSLNAPSNSAPTTKNQAVTNTRAAPQGPAWQDPAKLAQSNALVMPSNASNLTAAPRPPTKLDLGNGEQFPVTHVNAQVNGGRYNLADNPAPNKMNVNMGPIPQPPHQTAPASNQQDGTHLGWASGQGHVMNLGEADPNRKFFTTPKMNGCAIMIGGPPSGPTVMHANYDNAKLNDYPPMDGKRPMGEQIAQHQLPIYKENYGKIHQQAMQNGVLPQGSTMIEPNQYPQARHLRSQRLWDQGQRRQLDDALQRHEAGRQDDAGMVRYQPWKQDEPGPDARHGRAVAQSQPGAPGLTRAEAAPHPAALLPVKGHCTAKNRSSRCG